MVSKPKSRRSAAVVRDAVFNRVDSAQGALVMLLLVSVVAGGLGSGVAAATTTPSGSGSPTRPAVGNATSSPLIVTHSIVVSGGTHTPNEGPCSLQSRFYHGQKVIFRIKVVNPQTGAEMNGSQLSGVSVKLPNGKSVKAQYRHHGNGTFWIAPWTIPSSYPSGTVNYQIAVNGSNAKAVRYNVHDSQLTVLNSSLSVVKAHQSGQTNQSVSLPIGFWALFAIFGVATLAIVGLAWNRR